jgi:hypothetical protein
LVDEWSDAPSSVTVDGSRLQVFWKRAEDLCIRNFVRLRLRCESDVTKSGREGTFSVRRACSAYDL